MSVVIRNTVPASRIHGVTTPAPEDRPWVVVDLDLGGPDREATPGRALGWTTDAVLVEVRLGQFTHQAWVPAADVRRGSGE